MPGSARSISAAVRPVLEVSGINTFYGQAHILHDVSLKVASGEVVTLLGRNGAGKTTTLKSIMQLVPPQSGRVGFDDDAITGMATYKVCRKGIGYVPEDRRIFDNLSVAKNLEAGRLPARDGFAAWTPDRLYNLFPNLRERQDNQGNQLSGGEQQMLSIARTLMGNPKLLLLDEPSEGIAPVIIEQMAQTITDLKQQGLSILLSEQNLHFAKLVADRAYILETGTIKFAGTIEELEKRPEVRDAYLAI
ncbi:MAG: ABC transporter ATP-binding protein [Aestuariivirgaceae bacterium]